MKANEVTRLMSECGWVRANLDGGNLFTLQLADRFLVAMPQLTVAGGKKRIDAHAGVGFADFSRACREIAGEGFQYASVQDFPFRACRFEAERGFIH